MKFFNPIKRLVDNNFYLMEENKKLQSSLINSNDQYLRLQKEYLSFIKQSNKDLEQALSFISSLKIEGKESQNEINH